jgi:quercetin dioxygenase-like cupin family protein
MSPSGERVTVIAGTTPRRLQWARPRTAAASRVGRRYSRRRGCGAPICSGRISACPGREVVQSRVDIGPEAPLVKHTHPGEEIIYILEGSLEYQIEGQPPMTFSAGEALTVPAGVVYAVRNVGSGNAAELATYVVEKGKPLLTLAE